MDGSHLLKCPRCDHEAFMVLHELVWMRGGSTASRESGTFKCAKCGKVSNHEALVAKVEEDSEARQREAIKGEEP
jgi:uncharacterized C2H2 Zn-finger protein